MSNILRSASAHLALMAKLQDCHVMTCSHNNSWTTGLGCYSSCLSGCLGQKKSGWLWRWISLNACMCTCVLKVCVYKRGWYSKGLPLPHPRGLIPCLLWSWSWGQTSADAYRQLQLGTRLYLCACVGVCVHTYVCLNKWWYWCVLLNVCACICACVCDPSHPGMHSVWFRSSAMQWEEWP